MKIAIIGAMNEEVAAISSLLENTQEIYIGPYKAEKGVCVGHDLLVIKSGIGKVNAAIATTLVIEAYNPEYVINTGSAGALEPSLEVGDIVAASTVSYHDVDVSSFGYEYGQVPGSPAFFSSDKHLLKILEQLKNTKNEGQPQKFPQVVKGLIISGDSFIAGVDQLQKLTEKFSHPAAVEMEAAAISQVCYHYNVPFLIIRSISDTADRKAAITFEEFLPLAAKNSAELILKLMKEIK